MKYTIRKMRESEHSLLENFLYEAIFIPEGTVPPDRSIIKNQDLQVYVRDFGQSEHDFCLLAEVQGRVIGAVWTRIMSDYGHIDKETPSLAIALYRPYRGYGIGTAMMRKILEILQKAGYRKVSLSVQKANPAVRMYLKTGFEVIWENEEEFIMILYL